MMLWIWKIPTVWNLCLICTFPYGNDWCFMGDYVLLGFSAQIPWVPVSLARPAIINTLILLMCHLSLMSAVISFFKSVHFRIDCIMRKDTMQMLEQSIAAFFLREKFSSLLIKKHQYKVSSG